MGERKACRERIKSGLAGLRPKRLPRDAMTQAWLLSKCGRCMACPKFTRKLGIKPLPLP